MSIDVSQITNNSSYLRLFGDIFGIRVSEEDDNFALLLINELCFVDRYILVFLLCVLYVFGFVPSVCDSVFCGPVVFLVLWVIVVAVVEVSVTVDVSVVVVNVVVVGMVLESFTVVVKQEGVAFFVPKVVVDLGDEVVAVVVVVVGFDVTVGVFDVSVVVINVVVVGVVLESFAVVVKLEGVAFFVPQVVVDPGDEVVAVVVVVVGFDVTVGDFDGI